MCAPGIVAVALRKVLAESKYQWGKISIEPSVQFVGNFDEAIYETQVIEHYSVDMSALVELKAPEQMQQLSTAVTDLQKEKFSSTQIIKNGEDEQAKKKEIAELKTLLRDANNELAHLRQISTAALASKRHFQKLGYTEEYDMCTQIPVRLRLIDKFFESESLPFDALERARFRSLMTFAAPSTTELATLASALSTLWVSERTTGIQNVSNAQNSTTVQNPQAATNLNIHMAGLEIQSQTDKGANQLSALSIMDYQIDLSPERLL